MPKFVRRTRISAAVERVFRWHELPDAFKKLTPPGDPVRVIARSGGIRDGGRVEIEIGRWPLSMRWIAEHSGYRENQQFRDTQIRGPFRRWEHTHAFEADGEAACYLEDRIEYELPFGRMGTWLAGRAIGRKLARLFEYRHQVTRQENERPLTNI